jgi:hypothetical protein
MHRNDLENIPAFLAIGLIFVAINPSLLVARTSAAVSSSALGVNAGGRLQTAELFESIFIADYMLNQRPRSPRRRWKIIEAITGFPSLSHHGVRCILSRDHKYPQEGR